MTLNHIGTQTIETERLILRRFEITDTEDMFNNWASDAEVAKYLTWEAHTNIEATRSILEIWVKEYESMESYNWAIVLKDYGKVIGSIGLMGIDNNSKKCEVGYCISKHYWNKGIMTEALKAVIDYGFSMVGFNRIQAKHDVANPVSGIVMNKCGMQYEGVLRQFALNNKGKIIDISMWAILRGDYSIEGR